MKVALSAAPSHADTATLPILAKYKMLVKSAADRVEMAEADGAPDRVLRVSKSAVTVGATDTWGNPLLPDYAIAVSGYFEGLRQSSVFFNMLDAGLKKIPLRQRIGIVTGNASGYVRGEASARQLT